MNRIGSELDKNYKFCQNSGIEDVDVGFCLRKLGVKSEKSIDEYGKERFLPVNVNDFVNNKSIDWLHTYASNPFQGVINR